MNTTPLPVIEPNSPNKTDAPPSGRRGGTYQTDEDAFATLRKTWQPVCLSRDLDDGRIVSRTLMG
ncbi:MAG: hypothetical protein AAFX76_13080 [Planctomycetota bacterium]